MNTPGGGDEQPVRQQAVDFYFYHLSFGLGVAEAEQRSGATATFDEVKHEHMRAVAVRDHCHDNVALVHLALDLV